MEIRSKEPPVYGERVLFREIESSLDFKNPIIDEIMRILDEKGFMDEEDEVWARLCLDEVIINAIRHGNKEDLSKKVHISLYTHTKQWAIRVEDEGEGFSGEDVPDVEDEDSLELEHGRGVLLIKSYMDEIWYYDKGNRVQLMKEKKSRFRKLIDKILVFFGFKKL